jgi:hypothetical protein
LDEDQMPPSQMLRLQAMVHSWFLESVSPAVLLKTCLPEGQQGLQPATLDK